jgi:hypothetical protein
MKPKLFMAAVAAVCASVHAHDFSGRDVVATELNALRQVREGRDAFRHATFGSEAFWGDALGLHLAIAGSSNGGVAAGLAPQTALATGLKVDVDALPRSLQRSLARGEVNLADPATTLNLLRLDAVVGLTGVFDQRGRLTSVGMQCALCHSTVDDSFAKGIGRRRDGWPNRDLDIGALMATAPRLEPLATVLGVDVPTVQNILRSWGPGKFDATLLLDGKAMRPDGKSAAVLIPAAFGLAGVNLHTYTGWGGISHWNALVAGLEMHGQGTFFDPRLDDATKFPVAARNGFGNVRAQEDRITPLLPALQIYQLSLAVPKAPRGSFDYSAARRGERVFNDRAQCARCHVPPLFTEPGWNLHTPAEIGIDDFQSSRSPDGRYRTTPLRGLWTRAKGGFYHDGRFATLADVIAHYDAHLGLGLSAGEKADLVHYLKSL